MYHDVVDEAGEDDSGFPTPDAARYKLEAGAFGQHLDVIASAGGDPRLITDLGSGSSLPLLVTFDDGGVSAHTHIAPQLELRGWRGHSLLG